MSLLVAGERSYRWRCPPGVPRPPPPALGPWGPVEDEGDSRLASQISPGQADQRG